jgi:hypothetical protein
MVVWESTTCGSQRDIPSVLTTPPLREGQERRRRSSTCVEANRFTGSTRFGRRPWRRTSVTFRSQYLPRWLCLPNHVRFSFSKKKKKKKETRRYLFGDKYLFSILPNQQRARSDFCFDFVRGQLWSSGKVHHAEVKEIYHTHAHSSESLQGMLGDRKELRRCGGSRPARIRLSIFYPRFQEIFKY